MSEPPKNGPEQDKPEGDRRFASQAKELFDDSVERLDAATLSRLNKSRHQALAELQHTRLAGQWARWMPATGVAAAALVTVIILQGPGVEGPEPPAATVTDFEILLGEDSLEMLEELEFYSWIDPQDLETNGNVG
jgi:hypothetical protein